MLTVELIRLHYAI